MSGHFPSSRVAVFFIFVILLFAKSSGCLAADRVALVIGNGAYQKVRPLANPPRDAEDVAHALERLGFAVTRLNNSDLESMRKAISDFGDVADRSSMAVVFYAGHGIEAGGENWLIPVDAAIETNADAQQRAISLRSISQQVSKAKTLGLIILDACRDNPFKIRTADAQGAGDTEPKAGTRSVGRGLAPTEPSGNVLVAFAAKDGTVADDGDGRNSPFTGALLRHIEAEGVEVTFLFRIVRDEVMAATRGEQQPYVYGSLSRDSIYLRPPSSDQVLAAIPPIAPATRPTNALFTPKDESLIAEVAESKQLNPPIFQIDAIDPDVPQAFRRFVGVWVSKIGNNRTGRQIMLIVPHVDATGLVSGYYVWGPPTATTWNQRPAAFFGFKSAVRGNEIEFDIGKQTNRFKLLSDGRLNYQAEMNGATAINTVYPLWTLVDREQGKDSADAEGLRKASLSKGKSRQ
jgi:uncharacterized caspase-like protein